MSEQWTLAGLMYDGSRKVAAVSASSSRWSGRFPGDADGGGGTSAATPKDGQLSMLVRAAAATVREHLAFWQLGYAARHHPEITRALGSALTEWTDEILSVLSTLLRDAGGGEPELDAVALFAQIDGMCVHFALAPDSYPLEAVAERIIANFSRHLRTS